MPIYTHTFNPSRLLLISPPRKTLFPSRGKNFPVSRSNGKIRDCFRRELVECYSKGSIYIQRLDEDSYTWLNRRKLRVSALGGQDSGIESARKRRIVEHIFLLKTKENLSEDEEKDMLDYLYTSQYQMSGIIAVSLGRITDPNDDGFTHVAYMRFQKQEDLAKFYEISNSGVLKEHVMPYCHEMISVDYESEVEDDILPIFRRGEEFNYGVEFVLLISVIESALGGPVQDALAALSNLTLEFGSLIVQATQGSNVNLNDREYTHGAVIRFPSFEAMEIFKGSSQYKSMWRLKFQPITKKALAVHFSVDPVGTEIM
ncbi:stress responsive alpha-beta barrel domain protein isoform X1 [Tasmannia lanceolata]|uniref:stress responsive alpha-beta barrel domain protein isoform X1 n=1 Tax=Tasmannia lanceolata TaxID=3420 RepID=UPI0040635A8E